MFFLKNHVEDKAGRLVPNLLSFSKMLYIMKKENASILVSRHFARYQFGHKRLCD